MAVLLELLELLEVDVTAGGSVAAAAPVERFKWEDRGGAELGGGI